jgi:TRAP-type transport system periplasmic protein
VSRSRRLARVAVVVATALGATGCAGGGATKAGGDAVVTLRMADGYAVPELEPAVAAFVAGVQQRSGGRLRIEVTREYGNFQPDFEQRVVKAVAVGDFDLGWTGTRVYDTLGVPSFQALTAPLLIDSYPLQAKVIRSDIPGAMLPGLDRLGVTGLAVLAGGLRKPIAAAKPLLGPADWRGLTFAALRSAGQAATVRALGATPTDVITTALDEGLQRGTIHGFEKNLLIYALNHMEPEATHVTANVNLWPETAVLLANPRLLGRLSPEQAGWVRAAATDAASRSVALADADQGLVAERCAHGARFATATPAQLAALQTAVAPVITRLDGDPATKGFIARIRDLRQALPDPAPATVKIPAACVDGATSSRPSSSASAAIDPAALLGTWQTAEITPERLRAAFEKASGSAADAAAFAAHMPARRTVRYGLEITATGFRQFEVDDGGSPITGEVGSYTVDGTTLHEDGSQGCRSDYRITLTGDRLSVRVLREVGTSPDCGPWDLLIQHTIFDTAPFVRVR